MGTYTLCPLFLLPWYIHVSSLLCRYLSEGSLFPEQTMEMGRDGFLKLRDEIKVISPDITEWGYGSFLFLFFFSKIAVKLYGPMSLFGLATLSASCGSTRHLNYDLSCSSSLRKADPSFNKLQKDISKKLRTFYLVSKTPLFGET